MKYIRDYKNENPISLNMLRIIIMEADFGVAWYHVMVYILKAEMSPFHMGLMQHRLSYRNTLTMAGRGFGKSYTLTTGYIVTHMLRDRNIKIALLSRTHNQATSFVAQIQQYFTDDSVVSLLFGDLRMPGRWKKDNLTLKRSINHKDPTLVAASVESGSVVGSHYDIIILDDIVGMPNSSSPYQRKVLESKFFNEVYGTLEEKKGQIHAVGTHYHPSDFWTVLEEKGWRTMKVKSLEKIDGVYHSACPERKTAEMLLESRRHMGSMIFNMQFQQIIEQQEGQIFKGEWFRYFNSKALSEAIEDRNMDITSSDINDAMFDSNGLFRNHNTGRYRVRYRDSIGAKVEEDIRLFGAVDPATKDKGDNDYFVIAVIGIGVETGNIFLVDMERGRYTFHKQQQMILDINNKYPEIELFGVESVVYQEVLPEELKRQTALPILEIRTSKNKEIRMTKFSALWESGKVYINAGIGHNSGIWTTDERDIRLKDGSIRTNPAEIINVLFEEAMAFPGGDHDDTIDAFYLAIETYQKSVSGITETNVDFGGYI